MARDLVAFADPRPPGLGLRAGAKSRAVSRFGVEFVSIAALDRAHQPVWLRRPLRMLVTIRSAVTKVRKTTGKIS